MSAMKFPLRKVVRYVFTSTKYNRPAEGSNKFTLECGHTIYSKTSNGAPNRKRCRDCWIQYQRAGKLLHD